MITRIGLQKRQCEYSILSDVCYILLWKLRLYCWGISCRDVCGLWLFRDPPTLLELGLYCCQLNTTCWWSDTIPPSPNPFSPHIVLSAAALHLHRLASAGRWSCSCYHSMSFVSQYRVGEKTINHGLRPYWAFLVEIWNYNWDCI